MAGTRSASPIAGPQSSVLRALDHVYYWVANLGRAVAFYRDVLGLELVRQDGDAWAAFGLPGGTLALHAAIEGRIPPPGGATAVFDVSDLDSAKEILRGRGVEFDHEGEVADYARFASFRDPDGNTLQLIEYAAHPGAGG
jgi:catechol 2,3-dioxygenase-like lactoylglutathione lyase family enzyme